MYSKQREDCKFIMSSTLHPYWDDFETFVDDLCKKEIDLLKKYRKGQQGPEMVLHLTNRKDSTLLRFIPQREAIIARLVNLDNALNDNNSPIKSDRVDSSKKFLRFEYVIKDRQKLSRVQNLILVILNAIDRRT